MNSRIPLVMLALWTLARVAPAATITANFTSASTIPVTAPSYTATGNSVALSLGFPPPTGTNLTVVNNTGRSFINGQFSNLPQGQVVNLSYGGQSYCFVANYYGRTGNDLVLLWANNRSIAWGGNSYGQLGDNTTTQRNVPVAVNAVAGVSALSGKTVVAVSAGGSHFGGSYSLALCSDGTVATWGDNFHGQLGDNTTTDSLVPVAVNRVQGVSALYGKTVVAVAAGCQHGLALCSDGTVAAWGNNSNGQLGDNTTAQRYVPVAVNTAPGVSALYGKTVIAVSAGGSYSGSYSLALCSDGTVAAWGNNSQGQLGDNTTAQRNVPVAVNTAPGVSALYGKTVIAVSAGAGFSDAHTDHSLALCSDGTVAAWGNNYNGQLGDNTTTDSLVPVAVNRVQGVSALYGKTVVAVSAGGSHSLALCSNGTVAAWGRNYDGQLGDNTTTQRKVPVAVSMAPGVSALYGKTVIAVSAGGEHSLALCSDGTMVAWGYNGSGQLGDNTTAKRNVPVAVNTTPLASGERFTQVASGSGAYHSLALAAAPLSSVSKLSALIPASGMLSPSFVATRFGYTLRISDVLGSIRVTPTVLDATATVTVDGTAVTSGTASAAITLVPGTNTLTVIVTAQNGTTSTYTIVMDNTPYGVWKSGSFANSSDLVDPSISGEMAMPAHDGITNLMKYALALAPMTCGTTDLPTAAPQDGYLTLTYRKNKTATDVTYTVQASDSPAANDWSPATTVLTQTDEGDYWLVTVQDTVPQAGNSCRFMRLRVSR